MRKKVKWTKKRGDKQEDADSLLHNKSNPMFVQTFKILGFIVPERNLRQKISCRLYLSDRVKKEK